jgi:DNA-binding Lrp family transcriptional regulator
MKLSSPPTRYAFTSVIAAAMKYGPTRVSRIAYELDMPVETCRYYLKRFHNAGFRFFPVVDYWALGLQPCILFVRFSKKLDPQRRENFIRWFETVYTVYRAGLGNELEYYLETVPPQGDVKILRNMMETLVDAGMLENYNLFEIDDGYYKPEWIKCYDFTRNCWSDEVEINIPKIPLSRKDGKANIDLTDLLIISYLEENPTTKMNHVSQKIGLSPQLVSYHREKHVEGAGLITGFNPGRHTKHEDMGICIFWSQQHDGYRSSLIPYLHKVSYHSQLEITRLHLPINVRPEPSYFTPFYLNPMTIIRFTVPIEHFHDGKWMRLESFIENLEKIIINVI